MRKRRNGKLRIRPDDRGAMLITVLVLLLALTLIAALLLEESVLEHRLSAYEVERQQLRYGADSGMELARALLAGGVAVGNEAVELGFEPDDSVEVMVSLVRPEPEDGDEEIDDTVECIATASLISVSGRAVSGTVYCGLQTAPEGGVKIIYYRFTTGPH